MVFDAENSDPVGRGLGSLAVRSTSVLTQVMAASCGEILRHTAHLLPMEKLEVAPSHPQLVLECGEVSGYRSQGFVGCKEKRYFRIPSRWFVGYLLRYLLAVLEATSNITFLPSHMPTDEVLFGVGFGRKMYRPPLSIMARALA